VLSSFISVRQNDAYSARRPPAPFENLGIFNAMLLPGMTINTSPTNFSPIKQVQMERFDGERFIRFGPILGGALG
jgi:hypothetical protein